MKKGIIHLLLASFSAGDVAVHAEQRSHCAMKPIRLSLDFPEQGVAWHAGEESMGACEEVSPNGWVRRSSPNVDLLIFADGPSGSGRFWQVTVSIAKKQEVEPSRGFCIMTSTVGWRTLQRFQSSGLFWIDDGDDDGWPELVLWDSFRLSEDPSMAGHALVAWVYELDSKESLVLDWDLSRKMALEIATAYRTPIDSDDSVLQAFRRKAARDLEAFGKGRCTPVVDSEGY
jgi:hypothetical protein